MSLAIIGAGTAIASAGYSVYSSAKKNSQAKKLAAANQRPIFNADGSIKDVYNLALSEINNTDTQDLGVNQLQQNQMAGIDAMLKSGSPIDFQTVSNSYGSQLKQLISQVDAQRAQKIAAFNNSAYNVAQSNDAEFQYNQDAHYKDMKQQEAVLRQQSEQAKMDAISYAGSAIANYGIATAKPGQYGKVDNATPELMSTQNATFGNNSITPTQGAQINANSGPSSGAMASAGRNVPTGAVNTSFNYTAPIDYSRPHYQDANGNPIYTDGF